MASIRTITGLAFAMLSVPATPALAGTEAATALASADFALTAAKPALTGLTASRADREFKPMSQRSRDAAGKVVGEGTGPELPTTAVNYKAGKRGPVFEVGAFGGTVKPKPKLVHVALDWNF